MDELRFVVHMGRNGIIEGNEKTQNMFITILKNIDKSLGDEFQN
jgi:hypothetical protein